MGELSCRPWRGMLSEQFMLPMADYRACDPCNPWLGGHVMQSGILKRGGHGYMAGLRAECCQRVHECSQELPGAWRAALGARLWVLSGAPPWSRGCSLSHVLVGAHSPIRSWVLSSAPPCARGCSLSHWLVGAIPFARGCSSVFPTAQARCAQSVHQRRGKGC